MADWQQKCGTRTASSRIKRKNIRHCYGQNKHTKIKSIRFKYLQVKPKFFKLHFTQNIYQYNTFSCWQHKELAGTIRLVVEKRIQMNFNHHIMLLGILIILSTFLYIYVKAFFGRKYAKIKN